MPPPFRNPHRELYSIIAAKPNHPLQQFLDRSLVSDRSIVQCSDPVNVDTDSTVIKQPICNPSLPLCLTADPITTPVQNDNNKKENILFTSLRTNRRPLTVQGLVKGLEFFRSQGGSIHLLFTTAIYRTRIVHPV